jgi:hypothetical protein
MKNSVNSVVVSSILFFERWIALFRPFVIRTVYALYLSTDQEIIADLLHYKKTVTCSVEKLRLVR